MISLLDSDTENEFDQSKINPPSKSIIQIVNMGFTKEQAAAALEKFDDKVDEAINGLLNGEVNVEEEQKTGEKQKPVESNPKKRARDAGNDSEVEKKSAKKKKADEKKRL